MDQEEYLRKLTRSNMNCVITISAVHPVSCQTMRITRINANDALNDYLKLKERGIDDVLLEVEFPLVQRLIDVKIERMIDAFTDTNNDAWEKFGKEAMLHAENYRKCVYMFNKSLEDSFKWPEGE